MNTFHDALKELVDRAALRTTDKWPSYVTVDDVRQDIWVWAYENQGSVEKAIRAGDWEAKVYSTMLKVASSAASNEDMQTNGYSKEDTYTYSTKVLESLLESAFNYEDWQSFGTFGDGQPSAKGQVNETGDITAMLADVKAAAQKIGKQHREVLYYRFGVGVTHEQYGELKGISRQAATSRHKRAIDALKDELGRTPLSDLQGGYDGRREALGNEQSRVITDRQYEG